MRARETIGTEHPRLGGHRRRWRAPLVAATLALMLVAAACGGGGGQPAGGGGGQPQGSPSDAPPAAAAITATFGEFQLPPGTPGAGKPPIALGSKDFSEQDLLNELYTQALRTKGYTVNPQPGIGSTEVIDRVFAADQIQMYPEYLGVLATGPAGAPNPPNAQATYDVAQQFVQTQRQATLFLQTPFQNVDTIVVKPEYAQRFGLQTVADLNKVGPGGQGVRLAAQPSFQTRDSGLVGMARAYGLTNLDQGFVGLSAGAQVYQALDAGQADAADGFSTDPQLLTGQYVPLQDPQNIFGSQYVAPVVKQATAQQMGPEFEQTCNWVSGLLSTQAIQQMNQAVSGGQNPADVARSFLQQNGLA